MPETRSSSKHQRPRRRTSTASAGNRVIDKRPIQKKSTASKMGSSSSVLVNWKAAGPLSIDDDILATSGNQSSSVKNADMKSKLMVLQQQLDTVQSDMNKESEAANNKTVAAKIRADAIQHDLAHALQENIELKAGATADESRLILNCSQLEESINCEICVVKMWTPYILPECGHVFCITCLKDWFSTLLTQHKKDYPDFALNPPFPDHIRELSVQVRSQPDLRTQLDLKVAQYRVTLSIPQPVYTCPTCRVVMRNKPVEVFALKSVVGTISNAMGETSPKKSL